MTTSAKQNVVLPQVACLGRVHSTLGDRIHYVLLLLLLLFIIIVIIIIIIIIIVIVVV